MDSVLNVRVLPQSTPVVDDGIKRQSFLLNLTCDSNPATFHFDNVFKNVNSIEVRKQRVLRSEKTFQNHRNTPFVLLSPNWYSIINQNPLDSSVKVAFETKCGVKADFLYEKLSNNDSGFVNMNIDMFDKHVLYDFIPGVDFNSGNSEEALMTIIQSVMSLNDPNFFQNLPVKTSIVYGCFPFVVPNQDLTVKGITHYLNFIRMMLWFIETNAVSADPRAALFHFPQLNFFYDDLSNKFYIESNETFVIIPGNAFEVFGFRSDGIYVSRFNVIKGKYVVTADFEPLLNGSDVVYILCDETSSYNKNTSYEALSQVFLTNDPPINDIIYRNMFNIPYLPKLTLRMCSNLNNKQLYETNGKKWYVQLIVQGTI